jgi:hypothetical protein
VRHAVYLNVILAVLFRALASKLFGLSVSAGTSVSNSKYISKPLRIRQRPGVCVRLFERIRARQIIDEFIFSFLFGAQISWDARSGASSYIATVAPFLHSYDWTTPYAAIPDPLSWVADNRQDVLGTGFGFDTSASMPQLMLQVGCCRTCAVELCVVLPTLPSPNQ